MPSPLENDEGRLLLWAAALETGAAVNVDQDSVAAVVKAASEVVAAAATYYIQYAPRHV